jgi:hypothetical protein
MSRCFFLIVLLLLASCSLHERTPLPKMTGAGTSLKAPAQYPAIFPGGRWQFLHTIDFKLANGGQGTVFGVLVLGPETLHCVLMTIEGLVLFEAESRQTGQIEILRTVPPFDNQEFAAGLMDDVRTIFRRPQGGVQEGRLADGTMVFRSTADGLITDVLPQADGCWSINTYTEQFRSRTIRTHACNIIDSTVIPQEIDLASDAPAGYSLHLHLISAEQLKNTQ